MVLWASEHRLWRWYGPWWLINAIVRKCVRVTQSAANQNIETIQLAVDAETRGLNTRRSLKPITINN